MPSCQNAIITAHNSHTIIDLSITLHVDIKYHGAYDHCTYENKILT